MTHHAPSFLSEPQVVDIARLVQDVRQGDIQVPRFQRPFVWDDERRIELMRSIRSGIPIGSLLVWRTATKRLRCFDRIAGVTIPKPLDARTISFLLDGHQRVTSIFGAFVEGIRSEDTNQDDGVGPAPIVFNVERDDFEILTEKTSTTELCLPLPLFLDAVRLRRTFRDLERHGDRTPEQLDELQTLAEEVLNSIGRCRIPIIPLTTEDVSLATRTFHRVNSQGISITEVHMVAALSWKETFDLRERIEEAWDAHKLPEHWTPTKEQQVLNVIKGAFDLEIAKASEDKLIGGLDRDPEVVERAVEALVRAMRFASRVIKLAGPGTLPYEMQLTLLASALVTPDGVLEIQDHEAVRRWWGLTTAWSIFAGGSTHRVQAAFRHLKACVTGIRQPWPEVLFRSTEPAPVPSLDFRNARAKYFADGYARACGKQTLLAIRGTRGLVSLFKGRSTTPGNRFVWESESISALKTALSQGDLKTLRLHFVDAECVEYFKSDRAEDFISHRADLMNAQERAWFQGLDAEAFIGGSPVTPP